MERVKVVIPIYQEQLSDLERKIVAHNLEILKNHTTTLLLPNTLNTNWLKENLKIKNCEIIRVSDDWLGRKNGIAGYNNMMLSATFYRLFLDCEYILICQSDAYIFRDELTAWCDKGYDYIGAPWPHKRLYTHPIIRAYLLLRHKLASKKIIRQHLFGKVGNGGLSLRKIESFIAACDKYRDKIDQIRTQNTTRRSNEDVIWALMPEEFHYPTAAEAMHFSIDIKPAQCLREIGNTLPFGCHGITQPKIYDFWADKLHL